MKLYEHNLLAMLENHIDLETGELNEQSFNDAQAGLADKQLAVGAYILNLTNDIENLEDHINNLTFKLKSIQSEKDNLKKYLLNSLKQSNNLNLECNLKTFKITLSLERDKSVLLDDGVEFDEKYLIEQKPKISKTLILKDLESGLTVDGANIIKKDRLTIK